MVVIVARVPVAVAIVYNRPGSYTLSLSSLSATLCVHSITRLKLVCMGKAIIFKHALHVFLRPSLYGTLAIVNAA